MRLVGKGFPAVEQRNGNGAKGAGLPECRERVTRQTTFSFFSIPYAADMY